MLTVSWKKGKIPKACRLHCQHIPCILVISLEINNLNPLLPICKITQFASSIDHILHCGLCYTSFKCINHALKKAYGNYAINWMDNGGKMLIIKFHKNPSIGPKVVYL
jgi:hypothetical protein